MTHARLRTAPPHCCQAWVFAALDDEDGKARLYYWFAALYALPLLRSGFDFDWFTIAMLVTGIAHVQVWQPAPRMARVCGRGGDLCCWQQQRSVARMHVQRANANCCAVHAPHARRRSASQPRSPTSSLTWRAS